MTALTSCVVVSVANTVVGSCRAHMQACHCLCNQQSGLQHWSHLYAGDLQLVPMSSPSWMWGHRWRISTPGRDPSSWQCTCHDSRISPGYERCAQGYFQAL